MVGRCRVVMPLATAPGVDARMRYAMIIAVRLAVCLRLEGSLRRAWFGAKGLYLHLLGMRNPVSPTWFVGEGTTGDAMMMCAAIGGSLAKPRLGGNNGVHVQVAESTSTHRWGNRGCGRARARRAGGLRERRPQQGAGVPAPAGWGEHPDPARADDRRRAV